MSLPKITYFVRNKISIFCPERQRPKFFSKIRPENDNDPKKAKFCPDNGNDPKIHCNSKTWTEILERAQRFDDLATASFFAFFPPLFCYIETTKKIKYNIMSVFDNDLACFYEIRPHIDNVILKIFCDFVRIWQPSQRPFLKISQNMSRSGNDI